MTVISDIKILSTTKQLWLMLGMKPIVNPRVLYQRNLKSDWYYFIAYLCCSSAISSKRLDKLVINFLNTSK